MKKLGAPRKAERPVIFLIDLSTTKSKPEVVNTRLPLKSFLAEAGVVPTSSKKNLKESGDNTAFPKERKVLYWWFDSTHHQS